MFFVPYYPPVFRLMIFLAPEHEDEFLVQTMKHFVSHFKQGHLLNAISVN